MKMRKMRVKQFTYGHIDGTLWNWYSNPGSLTPESKLFISILFLSNTMTSTCFLSIRSDTSYLPYCLTLLQPHWQTSCNLKQAKSFHSFLTWQMLLHLPTTVALLTTFSISWTHLSIMGPNVTAPVEPANKCCHLLQLPFFCSTCVLGLFWCFSQWVTWDATGPCFTNLVLQKLAWDLLGEVPWETDTENSTWEGGRKGSRLNRGEVSLV